MLIERLTSKSWLFALTAIGGWSVRRWVAMRLHCSGSVNKRCVGVRHGKTFGIS